MDYKTHVLHITPKDKSLKQRLHKRMVEEKRGNSINWYVQQILEEYLAKPKK